VDDSEEALVLRSQVGDRRAFEELIRRTARLVYAKLYLETADAHQADDLSQETFLIAWRSIGQLHERSGFRPWLFSIARTVLIDSMRRDSRKKRGGMTARDVAEFPRLVADARSDPAHAAGASEERERVLELLRTLPAEYREPLMLRYIAGADYEEIGKQLGLSNGSLRGLLHRGMNRLREELRRAKIGTRDES